MTVINAQWIGAYTTTNSASCVACNAGYCISIKGVCRARSCERKQIVKYVSTVDIALGTRLQLSNGALWAATTYQSSRIQLQ